jgi:hypothetical protein
VRVSSVFKWHQQIYTLPKQNKTSDLKKALFRDKTQYFPFVLSFMLEMILFQLSRSACYLIYEQFSDNKNDIFFFICNNGEEKFSSAFLCCGLVSLFLSHFAVYGTK